MGATGYTLRRSRHSVAVRSRTAGHSFEWIAGQLGNSIFSVARVYGRLTPTLDERLRESDTTSVVTSPNNAEPSRDARGA